MPTNLDLEEGLVAQALRLTGLRTKKAVVEEGLRALIRLHGQVEVRRLRGLLHWQDPDPQPPAEKRKTGAGPR